MPLFDEESAADLAIVGLGPAGLAAGVRAASLGKQVLAFTDRDQYVRQQRIVLKDGSYVHELIEKDKVCIEQKSPDTLTDDEKADRKFYMKLEEEATLQIKDVETYLFRKLSRFSNVTLVPVAKNEPIIRIGSTTNCNYIEQAGIPPKRFHCNNILAADGAKHALADRVVEDLGKQITYSTSLFKPKHQYHATVQLQTLIAPVPVKTETTPFKLRLKGLAERLREQIREKSNSLTAHRWDAPYEPKNYIFTNNNDTKFCFTGEIPQSIFDEPDPIARKALLKTWASIFIKEKFNINADNLAFKDYSQPVTDPEKQKKRDKKASLQATVFKMDGFRFCEQPVVDLTHGVFACIGDARRTPYYRMAHGMADGIKLAMHFVDALGENGFDKQQYTAVVKEIDDFIDHSLEVSDETIAVPLPAPLTEDAHNALTRLTTDIKQWLASYSTQTTAEATSQQLTKVGVLVTSLEATQAVEPTHAMLDALLSTIKALNTAPSAPAPLLITSTAHEVMYDVLAEHAIAQKTSLLVEQIQDTLTLISHPH